MYDIIYKALVGLENEYEPQDYLNFFCLGNREADVEGFPEAGNQPACSPQVNLFNRYCISWCLLLKSSPLLNVLNLDTVLFVGTCT